MNVVYLVTNQVNGKRYVGQTSQSLQARWKRHQYPLPHRRNSYLYNAIVKHSKDNFTIEVLVAVETKEDMDYYERGLIKAWDLRNPDKGYNLTDGGGGMLGYRLSDETKAKMSSYVKTPEHCSRIAQAKMGNTSRLGLKHSEETRKKMSDSAKGRKFSEEHRRNLSIARRNRITMEI